MQSQDVTGPGATAGQEATAAVVAAPPGVGEISLPSGFRFGPVDLIHLGGTAPTPDLGPLAAFVGTWSGNGFNTIFRPNSTPALGDNILELNLTEESLSFSPSLGAVPNRGMVQADIFLNGVPYLQTISDVTTKQPVGIHVEPGLWMAVPSTADPAEPTQTLVRMASIPHGTTILAQGTASTAAGAPTIPVVSITPFFTGTHSLQPFPSQNAAVPSPARIPQDLAGIPITQRMLDDPNSVLRDHIASQHIVSTTTISITTSPSGPLFGGGTDNIAFLLGDVGALTNPNPPGQNAQTVLVSATFWIETVQHTIILPPGPPNGPVQLKPEGQAPGTPAPTFSVRPPGPILAPHPITVQSKQIQYSQMVLLNFNGLSWPHVSVATLLPGNAIPVPPGWP